MNKFTLALLVGYTSSINLSWPVEENQEADFLVNDSLKKKDQSELLKERKMETDDLLQLEKHIHTKTNLAQVSSSSSSKWVELPDCSHFVDETGAFTDPHSIQLKDDLTNAIIATCKGPMVMYVPPVPAVYKGVADDTNLYHARVYDDKVAGT